MTRPACPRFLFHVVVAVVVLAEQQGCVERQPVPEEEQISWDSPEMREIEKEWQSLQDAYDKTPEKIPGELGKDKCGNLETLIDRLFRKRLSDQELHQLATSIGAMPDRAFFDRVVEFMVRYFTQSGDRESLITVLSTRCPDRVADQMTIEFFLTHWGQKLKDPVLVLGEAFSKCLSPATRHHLAAAVRRGFAGLGISGRDDADYVANAMHWYAKEKNHLVANPNYWRNEMFIPLESYETNPRLYDQFPSPYKRELLFENAPPAQGFPTLKSESGQAELPVRNGNEKASSTDLTTGEQGLVALEGTWQVIEARDNGEPVPQEKIKSFHFVFHKGRLEWIGPNGKTGEEFRVRLGGQQEPSAMDLVQTPSFAPKKDQTTALVHELQDETTSAIYELKGDALRICLPRRGAWQRPSSFKAEAGSRETSFTLERVKE